MSLSNLFPSIRPSLLLDFANTESLDPRITFTRASPATYYDGVTVTKAEENLLLRSQDYSATWTVTNLTPVTGKTAPDGTSTATEFTASVANAVLTQGFTAIAGSYTFSVYLRRVTGTGDIQIAADNGTWNTKVITASWARYDITQTPAAGAKTAGIRVVDSGDAIEVWGAQLEQRSSVTAYTATTTQPVTNYIPVLLTAQNNVARFEHNPVTGESLGLEIEGQSTNLALQSENFSTTWADAQTTSTTVLTNQIVAPDGNLSADLLLNTTSTNRHTIQQTFTFADGTANYSASLYVKRYIGSGSTIYVAFYLGNTFQGTNRAGIVVDTTNGAVTNTIFSTGTATLSGYSVTHVGNNWYKLVISGNLGIIGSTAARVCIGVSNVAVNSPLSNNYAGNGYDGFYVWGAQLEAGSFATSYIATVATAQTREADSASMTGTNFSSWYNPGEGTLYGEGIGANFNGSIATVNSGVSFSNMIVIGSFGSTNEAFRVFASGVSQADFGTLALNTTNKLSLGYATNNVAGSINGASVLTAVTAIIPSSGIDALQIGRQWNLGLELNGTIKKLAYYPARLTDAQLQALTQS
jgi:hypothetical protein